MAASSQVQLELLAQREGSTMLRNSYTAPDSAKPWVTTDREEDPDTAGTEGAPLLGQERSQSPWEHVTSGEVGEDETDRYILPTEEEMSGPGKLRRVSGPISWPAYLIAFVELCERFSYYGTVGVFVNYLQRPLPPGSTTGSNPHGTPGALGLGTHVSTGITTFNVFWVNIIPLFGAYIADSSLGRYKTVCWSVGIALVGHMLMIVCSLPSIITQTYTALTIFCVALMIMSIGTGGFKANIGPLVAEQTKGPEFLTVVIDSEGQRVIIDPSLTAARIYMYFYLMITTGSFVGRIGMTYAEKYVGFWLAFTLPTLMFCSCPFVLWAGRHLYTKAPPSGSVLGNAVRIWRTALSPYFPLTISKIRLALSDTMFWENVKPTLYAEQHGYRPSWMTFSDEFVDEVRTGFKACQVFFFFPFYWMSQTQLINNLTSQAATMTTNGVPNDVITNIAAVATIILIPLCDSYIYPALRRAGISFTPLQRIFAGFMTVVLSMMWAGTVQYYIYTTSPCGYYANDPDCEPSLINVWMQSGAYILIAISEIFAAVTGYEYAFTQAPKSMRSLVTALFIFTVAISSAMGEIMNPLVGDPLLIWNYAVSGTISFLAGIAFWMCFRNSDREQSALKEIAEMGAG